MGVHLGCSCFSSLLSLQSAANSARELVIQRLIFVGKVCENEEQRLLEEVHAEEERAQQSILTQQAHWTEALQKLSALRTYLVDTITNLDDQGLVVSAPPPPPPNQGMAQLPRNSLGFSLRMLRRNYGID